MRAPARSRTLGLSLAAALLAALLGWWLVPSDRGRDRAREPRDASAAPNDRADAKRASLQPGGRAPRPAPRARDKSAALCAPHARQTCHAGDVYWLDACDQLAEKAEECGARLCEGDACEPLDARACTGLPAEGICEDDVVRGCLGGWPFERDCRALGKRCVQASEGAVCRAPHPDDCDPATPARCNGQVLTRCVEGRQVALDCTAIGARCERVRRTDFAACVAVRELERPPREHDTCGPCGCDDAPRFDEERCNGADDDGDERIDEETACEPLEVVAFVVSDGRGGSSYAREEIEEEITRLDALFTEAHAGLTLHVALVDVVDLPRPEYLELESGEEAGALVAELGANPLLAPSHGLRVPLVFTDEVVVDDAPKAGMSTLPNGYCGGLRLFAEPQPLRGLVAVAKRRAVTTLAHELGHFLGLCHTHETHSEPVVELARWREADSAYEATCDPSCTLAGDGMCDTPLDPGPTHCLYDARCDVRCAGGELPSTRNLMSYYTDCRTELTPWQTVELARTRALYEGWLRCQLPGACPCALEGELATASCPEQMSCRPTAEGLACTLDGGLREGERCRTHRECGAGLLCGDKRCVKAALLAGAL